MDQTRVNHDEKQEFKLSFKPNASSSNNSSNNRASQWMSTANASSNSNNHSFLTASSISASSILTAANFDHRPKSANSTLGVAKSFNSAALFVPSPSLQQLNCHDATALNMDDAQSDSALNRNASHHHHHPHHSHSLSHTINVLHTSHSSLPGDADVIFHESVPIMFKTSLMESNTRHLTVKIEKMLQLPQNQQILSITVTDESDPFFLYSLTVNENDFHQLKADQALLVDFAVFPKSLVMLLQQCLQCQHDEHPKFVAVLVHSASNNNNHGGNGSAILSVQETNQFRHLQQISLRLCAASTEQLREYLGKALLLYKTEYNGMTRVLHETKKAFQGSKQEKKKCEQHLSQIKQKYEQCICELKTSHASMINALKEDHLQRMEEARKKSSADKASMEKQSSTNYKQLEYKYGKLKEEFDAMSAEKLSLDTKHSHQTQLLQESRAECDAQKQELLKLREECKRLDELKYRHEKELNQYLIEISALKQQVKDKEEISLNSSNLLDSERAQKKSMEEQLRFYKSNLEKTEKKVKECVKEINKGNDIISHLQNEIRNQRNKNKLKEQKIQSMEQLRANGKNDQQRLSGELQRREDTIEQYKQEIKELKSTLTACKEKLQQSQKAIESNQRVITYLNKQLSDSQLGNNVFASSNIAAGSGGGGGGVTPSPFFSKLQPTTHSLSASALNGMSALKTMNTAISPILNMHHNQENDRQNNHENVASPSSYFPQ